MSVNVNIYSGRRPADIAPLIPPLVPSGEVFVVYDRAVTAPVREIIEALGGAVRGSGAIDASEIGKSFETVEALCREMMSCGISRKGVLLCVGGGITSDIGGFAASIYKRGIPYINVPTTLLAQVDAAIGGKNGVNFCGYKNMLGTIVQPLFTFVCPAFLETLPHREFLCGLSEMVKTFLIADSAAYDRAVEVFAAESDRDGCGVSGANSGRFAPQPQFLGSSGANSGHFAPQPQISEDSCAKSALFAHETGPNDGSCAKTGVFAHELVVRAAEIKAEIVREDPYEKGRRAVLNFGHTFAHAIEHIAAGKGDDIAHGEAVAMGMVLAARLSDKVSGGASEMVSDSIREMVSGSASDWENDGVRGSGSLEARLRADFSRLGLPTECPYPLEAMTEAMSLDKKASGGKVKFVLLEVPGKPFFMEIEPGKVIEILK